MANRKSFMVGAAPFVLIAFGCQDPAYAQSATQAYVVANCGTPGITLTAGKYGPVFQNTGGSLCTSGAGGGGGGLAVTDGTTFTAGTSQFTPIGGEYNSSPTSLTSGDQGTLALTSNRAAFIDVMTTTSNLYTVLTSATPAGANSIGQVGSDPSSGKGTPTSIPISISTGATTQLVALSGSTKIYVTSYNVIAGGTGTISFVTGTGTACANGSTTLTGAYPLTAQAGIASGNGAAAVLITPAGGELCATTSTSVQMSGSLSYQQF